MKRKLSILISLAVVAAVAAGLALSAAQRQALANDNPNDSPNRDEFEYLVVAGGAANLSPTTNSSMRKEPGGFNREWFPVEQNMDKLGAKGWELVSVTGPVADPIFFFKRRKQ